GVAGGGGAIATLPTEPTAGGSGAGDGGATGVGRALGGATTTRRWSMGSGRLGSGCSSKVEVRAENAVESAPRTRATRSKGRSEAESRSALVAGRMAANPKAV